MKLTKLNAFQLRNINHSTINVSERFNIFCGCNGSGKTSLLEAIYMLFNGYSFRTREIQPLITYGKDKLQISGTMDTSDIIAIQKSRFEPSFAKLNQRACNASSQLARLMPCQIFHQEIFQIIDSTPSVRRGMFDWGLFHVEQSFHSLWREYKHILKQRNALLKTSRNYKSFMPWDNKLVSYSQDIDRLRKQYFELWKQQFNVVLPKLTHIECQLEYYNGWSDARSDDLDQLLKQDFMADLSRQYTRLGAHSADIKIIVPNNKAKRVLSRGQQKIILFALKIAQAELLNKDCLFLFDDLHAELDSKHVENVLQYINSIRGQFFITAIEPYSVLHNITHANWYIVEEGTIVSRETISM